MPAGEIVARLRGVTKRYGAVTAIDAVDLDVHAGQVVGLLGPNGAGKTTLVHLLSGLRRPDAGSVRLLGGNPRTPATRRRLGVTPQETGMPGVLRVAELARWAAAHYPHARAVDRLLADFGLSELAARQFGSLSGGQKRRLTVALAFAGEPDLVLLDEPTTGLDVSARRALWEAIRRAAEEGRTIVLTSHYLDEVEALADRIVVLGGGRVLADGSLDQVRSLVGLTRVVVTVAADVDVVALGHVAHVDRHGGRVEVLSDDADAFVRALVERGIPFSGLQVRSASLEEAFLALTEPAGGARRPDPPAVASRQEV